MKSNVEELRLQIAQLNSELHEVRSIAEELEIDGETRRPYGTLLLGVCAAVAVLAFVAATPPSVSGPLTVLAPFRVVDSKGKIIFHVQEQGSQLSSGTAVFNTRGAYVLDSSQSVVVAMIDSPLGGGLVKAMKKNDVYTRVGLGAMSEVLGVTVSENDKGLVFLGKGENGENVVYVKNSDGKVVAGLATPNDSGTVAVWNAENIPIAVLQESAAFPGGGAIAAMDPQGNSVFRARANAEGGEVCIEKKGLEFCLGPHTSVAGH